MDGFNFSDFDPEDFNPDLYIPNNNNPEIPNLIPVVDVVDSSFISFIRTDSQQEILNQDIMMAAGPSTSTDYHHNDLDAKGYEMLQITNQVCNQFTQNHEHAFVSTTTPQRCEPPTGLTIADKDHPGPFFFDVSFDSSPYNLPKSIGYTYSEILNELFVLNQKPFPIKVSCGIQPPADCVLRALLVYTTSENSSKPVKRCRTHETENPAGSHVLVSEDPNAKYEWNSGSDRDSIVVRYVPPEPGMTYHPYKFRLMCLRSCPGGSNRRPMKLVLTLEDTFGYVVGRKTFFARSCGCPGRDRQKEESLLPTIAVKTTAKQSKRSTTMMDVGSCKKRKLEAPHAMQINLRGTDAEKFEEMKKILHPIISSVSKHFQVEFSITPDKPPQRKPAMQLKVKTEKRNEKDDSD